ncbi:hypothetical protein BCR42DRAFT_439720 [Absidia repens]|uniref:GATA-type domain-containing protein n=1 Tax=Absidia repens TaxID=90262 RepID=A0A1X2IBH5_9FUNG|nr:hypothetical protein BCR42DRAFT_439720 [Absidia repens]
MKRHLYCSTIQQGGDTTDSFDIDRVCALSSPEGSEALLPSSETPHSSFPLVMSHDQSSLSSPGNHTATPATPGNTIGTSIALPPKKRKKRRIVRHSVIFTLAKECDPHYDLSSLPADSGCFYVFPRNTLIDVTNDLAPFQIICTFHLFKSSSILRRCSKISNASSLPSLHAHYQTKLEGLAAICDTNNHLVSATRYASVQLDELPQVDSEYQLFNVEISSASGDICHSLKETVADYQTLCQKMAKLLQVHNQHLTAYKNERTCYPEYLPTSTLPSIAHGTSHHLKTEGIIDNARSLCNQRQKLCHEEQQCDVDIQNGTNIPNHSNTIKRQHNMKKHGQQNGGKVTKRPYNRRKNNHSGSSVNSETKADACVKEGCGVSATKKKTKRMSVSRGKESSNPANTRQCFYCGVTETPMWRRGPEGGGTLCNACGVKWKNGKILATDSTNVVVDTDQKYNSGTKLNNSEHTSSKRKSLTSNTMKEKRTKYDHIDSTTDDLIMDNESKDLRLHEYSDASTPPDHHLQSYKASSSIAIDVMDSLTMDCTASTTKYIIPTTTSTSDDNSVISSTTLSSSSSSSSSSSEFIHNSPPLAASIASSTKSSPPTSMNSRKHQPTMLTDNLVLEGSTVSLTPGADDVEAAALLTLLSQS